MNKNINRRIFFLVVCLNWNRIHRIHMPARCALGLAQNPKAWQSSTGDVYYGWRYQARIPRWLRSRLGLRDTTIDSVTPPTIADRFVEVQTPKEAFRSISWKFHGKAGWFPMGWFGWRVSVLCPSCGSCSGIMLGDFKTTRCLAERIWRDVYCVWRTRWDWL